MLHLGALRRVALPLLSRDRRAAALRGGHYFFVAKLFAWLGRRLVDTKLGDDAHVVAIFVVDEDEADALLRWVAWGPRGRCNIFSQGAAQVRSL